MQFDRDEYLHFPKGTHLRQRLNQSSEFVATVPMTPCEVNEFSSSRDDRADLGRARHRYAPAAAKLQEALIAQHSKGSKHRIRVDVEYGRQVSRGR